MVLRILLKDVQYTVLLLFSYWVHQGISSRDGCHYRRDSAIEASPSGGYSPIFVACPANFTVRVPASDSSFLGKAEAEYIAQRAGNSTGSWESYLERAALSDFDYRSFLEKTPVAGETRPNIAMALSGGGLRALLGEAGLLNAFDDRNPQAVQAGTGGILQLTNYMTGLSGGSWLLGSWATSNYPVFTELNRTVWNFTQRSSYTSWNSIKNYPHAISQAKQKFKAGFPTSLVDIQAYLLSHHLINDTHHGSKVLFSSIRDTPRYQKREAPFPILLSKSRIGGVTKIDDYSPIYEFSPEEFGVCHPSLTAFVPLELLGTSMISGKPADPQRCAKGFDNAGFVIGASSNILSQPGFSNFTWKKILPEMYDKLIDHVYDEAIVPNPFYKMGIVGTDKSFPEAESRNLYLADGGWGGEVLPFWPLLQPDRKMDVIIALDFSADGPSMFHGAYPNGTSLFTTYLKTQRPEYKDIHFPKIPNPSGPFSEQGLNQKASFFGCNETQAPLIVYFPNYNVLTDTKHATMKVDYRAAQIDAIFENSFAIATQNHQTDHSNGFQYNMDSLETVLDRAGPISKTGWSICLACALIDRQLIRNKTPRSPQCEQCFQKYCA